MKVTLSPEHKDEHKKYLSALTLGKSYPVLSIEIYERVASSFAQFIGDHILYRIENDEGSVIPYPSTLFLLQSNKIPTEWVVVKKQDVLEFLPESWSKDGFWERYYNDESTALQHYQTEKQKILLHELSTEDIESLLQREDYKSLETVLRAIHSNRDQQFIGIIVKSAKHFLKNLTYSQSSTLLALLILSFSYLSNFEIEEVEQLFIEYLSEMYAEHIELTVIVNQYFLESRRKKT